MSEEKYFIWGQTPAGWGHDDWTRYHCLSIAKYLGRTAIIPYVQLRKYHNLAISKNNFIKKMVNKIPPKILEKSFRTSEHNLVYNPKNFYDLNKINKIMTVKTVADIDENDQYEINKNINVERIHKLDCEKKYHTKFLIANMTVVSPTLLYKNKKSLECYTENIDEILNNLVFSKKIYDIAQKIVDVLGDYDAVHIRRGDFALWPWLWGITKEEAIEMTTPDFIFKKMRQIIPRDRKIYLATNEVDLSLFDDFKKEYNIYYRQDFNNILEKEVPDNCYNMYYLLCIEEIVMSHANKYLSTINSSGESTINWMRSEIEGIDHRIFTMNPDGCLKSAKKNEEIYFYKRSLSTDDYRKRMFWW